MLSNVEGSADGLEESLRALLAAATTAGAPGDVAFANQATDVETT